MDRRRLVSLLVAGAAIAACGFDGVGRFTGAAGGPSSGDASTTADGSSAIDGGDANVSIMPEDAGGDAADGAVLLQPACEAGKVLCGGVCITASDCTGCANTPYLCAPARACVTACASCRDLSAVAMPIECYACDSDQSGTPVGTCAYNNATGFCLNANYSTAFKGGTGEHCDCSGTNVGNCPGRSQVCKPHSGTDWCITCGETGLATNGLPCNGGGICNTSVSPPRCM